jgi:hypothetical protein
MDKGKDDNDYAYRGIHNPKKEAKAREEYPPLRVEPVASTPVEEKKVELDKFVNCPVCKKPAKVFDWPPHKMALCGNVYCSFYHKPINPEDVWLKKGKL